MCGSRNHGTLTPWGTIQRKVRRSSYPSRQRGWDWSIMLSEISQAVKDTYHVISPINGT